MADKHLKKLGGAVYSSKKVESNFGSKILAKCGWKDGEGLGKNAHGMKECIQITKRYESEGLGKKAAKMNDAWWEKNYNSFLGNLKGVVTRSRSISIDSHASINRKISDKKIKKRKDSSDSDQIENEVQEKINNKSKKIKTNLDNNKSFKVVGKKVKIIHFSDEEN